MFLVKIISFGTIYLLSTGTCCPSQTGMFGTNTSKKYFVPVTTTTTTTTTTTHNIKDLDAVLVVAGGIVAKNNSRSKTNKTELVKFGNPSNIGSCNELNEIAPAEFGGCGGYFGNTYVACGKFNYAWHCYYLDGSHWIESYHRLNYTFVRPGCLVLPEISGLLVIGGYDPHGQFVIHYGNNDEKPIVNGTILDLPFQELMNFCVAQIDRTHFLLFGGSNINYAIKNTFILEANTSGPFTTLQYTRMGKKLNTAHAMPSCGRIVDDKGRNLAIVLGGGCKAVEFSDIANNGGWSEPTQFQLPVTLTNAVLVDVAPNGFFLVGGQPDGHAIYHLPCIHTADPMCVWYKRDETIKTPRQMNFVTFMLRDPKVKCDNDRNSMLKMSSDAPKVCGINLAFLSVTQLLHMMLFIIYFVPQKWTLKM